MEDIAKLADGLVKKITDMEKDRHRVSQLIRKLNESNEIILSVEKQTPADLTVAAIDGGLVKRSLHGMDIMLLRAVGALFLYKDGKLQNVEYFPDVFPNPEPRVIFDSFSDLEFEFGSNIERQTIEVVTARQVIEKFNPDILLMDGSIVPHYTERPSKNSPLMPIYEKMIDSYRRLFELAQQKRTVLAGVIEDSRGAGFCNLLNEKFAGALPSDVKFLLERMRDTVLLTYALKFQERTLAFSYSPKPEDHPVLKEFGPFASQINSFYLKTAEFDRPIRIDFLGSADIDKLSSIILATTGNSIYGMPAAIIEADQRAKLSERDLELFYSDLLAKAGNLPGLMSLRREQRPF